MLKLRHHVASQRIQGFLEVFFILFSQYKMRYLHCIGEQENKSIFDVRMR